MANNLRRLNPIVKCAFVILAIVLFSLRAWPAHLESDDLPDAIVGCGYLLESAPDAIWKANGLATDTHCEELMSAVAAIDERALAFDHQSFVVQDAILGNTYGFVRKKGRTLDQSSVPFKNLIFVTTPIRELHNKVLVIASNVRPESTTISTVDGDMHLDVLYDSFKKSSLQSRSDIPLGSVYQVKTMGTARFLLQERRDTGGAITNLDNRVFLLDLSKGSFSLKLVHDPT